MAQLLRDAGIYIMPVFKSGTVVRITLPRLVQRMLQVSKGDYVLLQQNDRGELVIRKFDAQRLRDEYIQNGSAQLDLGTAGPTTPRP